MQLACWLTSGHKSPAARVWAMALGILEPGFQLSPRGALRNVFSLAHSWLGWNEYHGQLACGLSPKKATTDPWTMMIITRPRCSG